MDQVLGVDLFCSHCGLTTVHQAVIADGRMNSLRCLTCDQTTELRPDATEPIPEPFPSIQVGPLHLGQGEPMLEGAIRVPAQLFMQQALAVVRDGLSLREMDCRVLRLYVETPEQLQFCVNLKAVTGLPVLVDVEDRLTLLASVSRSQADGVVFTYRTPEDADIAGISLGSGYPGLIAVRLPEANSATRLDTGLTVVQRLGGWHDRNLAITPLALNPAEFVQFARLWRNCSTVPIRAELPLLAAGVDRQVAGAVGLGVICSQPGIALASLPVLKPESRALYETAAVVIDQLKREREEDLLAALVHMAGKAVDRVVSKPGRVLHEMESAPSVFMHSLPRRIITKPMRVVGEIRRLLRKSS